MSTGKKSNQRALVIGVSEYLPPISTLAAVSADVREIAKLLGSTNGDFSKDRITVLADKLATKNSILKQLEEVFENADEQETLFVYLAGHGCVEGGTYYFLPYDTDLHRIPETAVTLTAIKSLFDHTLSKQVCLWLDFCHSGGILQARGAVADDWEVVKRTVQVIQGQGKVILAACSPQQAAYESSVIGHGLFTNFLLRGLKGEARAGGEITVTSLFDFIDREVGSHRQRPEFFGHLRGRMVLMHLEPAPVPKTRETEPSQTEPPASNSGTWVLLNHKFFNASIVRRNKDGTITLQIAPMNGDQEADLASLTPTRYGGTPSIAFACNNDAATVQVKHVENEIIDGRNVWILTLETKDTDFGSAGTEFAVSMNGKTYSSDEIAALRAGRILLNDPPPKPKGRNTFDSQQLLEMSIAGTNSRYPINDCPIRSAFALHMKNPNWKHFARLLVVYALKASGTVEHIMDLSLGPVENDVVQVTFRGRRHRQYSNKDPEQIEIQGECLLR